MTGGLLRALSLGLAGLARAQRISVGLAHKLSIHPDGTRCAWGRNDQGQLGTGNLANLVQLLVVSDGTPGVGAPATWALTPNPAHNAV